MDFLRLATYLQRLESTASRNAMVEILAELFSESGAEEIDKICYLTQGRVVPLFTALEFGMADRMMIKAIAKAYDMSASRVNTEFKKSGDLGVVVEKLKVQSAKLPPSLKLRRAGKTKVQSAKLSVNEVFTMLEKVARAGGSGSVDVKVNLISQLLQNVDSLSARYIVRIPLAKMRLGFSDMTVLDSLSWMLSKSKENRKEIERAYNVRPDLGYIAKAVKEKGIKGLSLVTPLVGTPILMARAERLSSGAEIIEKIGTCAVEPKIDGFRLQGHLTRSNGRGKKLNGGEAHVKLFTRNLEDATFMYPDVVEGIEKQIQGSEVIFEGEAVAYHPQTGEYLPFQETVQRKRKYDIDTMRESVPLKLICFDLLYLDGKNYLNEPYRARRQKLEKVIGKGETVLISNEDVVEKAERLEQIFQDSITKGLEGVMAKRLDGVYQAGARGWNWVKYKRSYDSKLDDTIDAVVMGYDFGQGKRVSFGIGDFLIGVYDKKSDTFKTIAKIGTGLTDEEWKQLKVQSAKFKVQSRPSRYDVDKLMSCDAWVTPSMVVVIKADEITRSPVHTAGRVMALTKGGGGMEVKVPGFALRFPRLVDFRSDKLPEDATSLREIEEMFGLQGRQK